MGVDGNLPSEVADIPIGNERTRFPDRAESIVLELHQNHPREVVVDEGNVDVSRSEPRSAVEILGNRTMSR